MKTHISQLIDFSKVDALLEGFNRTTGFVTAILDLEGNILSKSGWRSVCTDFHRIHPTTACNCTISDTILANKMAEGEKYHFYKCMNGLVDVAMPIVLNGEHVANLFSGQFFFEEPDIEFFRMQAKKYGFDEEKYLDALSRVPVVSEEKVKTAMDFLHQMTQLISERSLEKVELLVAKEKAEENEIRFKQAQLISKAGIYDWDIQKSTFYWSDEFLQIFGLPSDTIAGFESWKNAVHPDDYELAAQRIQESIANKTELVNEYRIILPNNEIRWINASGKTFYENEVPVRMIGLCLDITGRKETENLITNLSTSFAHLEGKSFFEAICEDAAKALKLDYVFVGLLNDNEHSITVMGGYAKGLAMGDLTYNLAGTPCDNVVGKEVCAYPLGIQKLFPYDKLLQLMGVEGYIGVPLFSKDNKAIGIIVALHENNIENPDKVIQIFAFYAERVSAELQRSIAEEALRESESQFRGLFNFAADAIFIADIETGIILHANEKAGLLTKRPVDELIGKHQRELHPSEKNKFSEDTFNKHIKAVSQINKAVAIENVIVCSDGTQIPVEIIASEVKYRGRTCLMGIFRDVSERKKYEEELIIAKEKAEENEKRLIEAQSVAKVGSWETNLDTFEVIWSDETYKIFELDRDFFKNSHPSFLTYVHPDDIERIEAIFAKSFATKHYNSAEHRIITPSGKLKYVEERWIISHDKNEKPIKAFGTCQDITEQKQLEIKLNETMEQVQKYSKHLQKVREEEKALLAREIHDELGQLLVALKLDTGVTTTQYNKAESDEDKEKIKLKLSKHADMITKAISSARRIMYGLRPVKLEMLGFAGACEDYLEDFSTRYEIECNTDIDLDIEKLDDERSLAMYRILQETTMNVVKHALATTVEVKYYQVENDIIFEVKDNGIGFTVGKDGREDSYGLLGINERVSLLKGTLEIDSLPGKGTRVAVRFPLG